MTGKIFGDLGNESLWRIKFDVLKSSKSLHKRHLILFYIAVLHRLLTSQASHYNFPVRLYLLVINIHLTSWTSHFNLPICILANLG